MDTHTHTHTHWCTECRFLYILKRVADVLVGKMIFSLKTFRAQIEKVLIVHLAWREWERKHILEEGEEEERERESEEAVVIGSICFSQRKR